MEGAIFILVGVLFLAYANGANDNFKGVATLFGSETTAYKKALGWATLTTFLGSLTAFFFATKLVKNFSGKGLVPDILIATPDFTLAVALGAGTTVFLATVFGFPISTTHSLTGALMGAGWVAVGSQLGFATLGKNFFLPLLLSPCMAVLLTVIVYSIFRYLHKISGIKTTTCICVGEKIVPTPSLVGVNGRAMPIQEESNFEVFVDEKTNCEIKALTRYEGKVLGIDVQRIIDYLHFISAGMVSFARGLNDTPKIVALCVSAQIFNLKWNILFISLVMALGGIMSARKVAETMSHRITQMTHGQGFTANLITSFLVIFASKLGLPVSTTHVSCGSLFGIGLVSGGANTRVITSVVSAWVLTLPLAALLGGTSYFFSSVNERMNHGPF